MRSLFSSILRSALIGAAIALPILGVGGRALMRVIAHWEGRVPVLTLGGTATVLFAATMAGVAAGVVHGIMRRYIRNLAARNILFLFICVAFTWRAVNALLPRPRLMFVALTVVYVIVLEVITSKREVAAPFSPDQSLNPT